MEKNETPTLPLVALLFFAIIGMWTSSHWIYRFVFPVEEQQVVAETKTIILADEFEKCKNAGGTVKITENSYTQTAEIACLLKQEYIYMFNYEVSI